MDRKTAEYYSAHAAELAVRYNSAGEKGIDRWFERVFPAGSSVLDIGCGSGRDMALLSSMGYDVYGVDPSPEMLEEAIRSYPGLQGRIVTGYLPSDIPWFDRKFDCVLCSAVLMHIPDESLEKAARTIRESLNEDGRLLISVPLKRDDLDLDGRTPDGRLHIIREPGIYKKFFESLGFREDFSDRGGDSLGRGGIEWCVISFRCRPA
ncbi:MAG TPA: class I SAM-dependent methyltransferase [Spirochaetota bacterium]|nr:class I SAM-dependent methyltransferase [Spirochaetota bacterium]